MNKCRQINYKMHFCDKLFDYVKETEIKTDRLKYCPFCKKRMKVFNNGDPWLYDEAIVVRWLPGRLDREIVRYKGQSLDGYEYYVHGTPWEFLHRKVEFIEIDFDKSVFYEINVDSAHMDSFYWATCPESIKSDNLHKRRRYERPKWTKYLPVV